MRSLFVSFLWLSQKISLHIRLLTKHKHVLDAIATELIRVETMERDEYEKILTLHGIKARRKLGEEPYVAPEVAPLTNAEMVTRETVVSESNEHDVKIASPRHDLRGELKKRHSEVKRERQGADQES